MHQIADAPVVDGAHVGPRLRGGILAAREPLAPIEGFPPAVEAAVIVRGEPAVRSELAGEQPGSQRDARQNADPAFAGRLEEELGRSMTEHVEDDLDAL